jgi:hypothetical protein
LLNQTDVKLSLVAVIDGAETARDGALMALLKSAGAAIIINDVVQGPRRAFAEGLRRAIARSPGDEGFFAYCDQDDAWHPDKLWRSVAYLREQGAALVHCDARILDVAGNVIAPSLHRFEGRQEGGDLMATLLLNAVTGMTAVFPARTARAALSVLDRYNGPLLHDHVTAAVAASLGKIAFVNEALVDYVQHGANQIGARRPRPALRLRALGLTHLAAYRATSAEIFEERRVIASALADEDLLPLDTAMMFLVGQRPATSAFVTGLYAGNQEAGACWSVSSREACRPHDGCRSERSAEEQGSRGRSKITVTLIEPEAA